MHCVISHLIRRMCFSSVSIFSSSSSCCISLSSSVIRTDALGSLVSLGDLSAEKKSIAEIKRCGIVRIKPAKKGPDSIIQGIGFLQQFEWIVDDRCVKTIEELENYTYQKDRQTNEYINKPVDSYNHCIDAIRYAVEPINGSGAPKAV